MGGFMSITDLPGQGPVRVGISIDDLCGLLLAQAVWSAITNGPNNELFGKQFRHTVIALDNAFEAVASMGCLSPSVKSNAAKHRSSNIASSARSCSTVPGDSEE